MLSVPFAGKSMMLLGRMCPYATPIESILRLEEWKIFLESDLLHRRWDYLARAALRFVGLRDDSHHLEPLTDQRPERRSSEIRRTPEENAHYISSAVSRLCAPGGSRRTFRI